MTYINPCLALYAVGTIGAAIIIWFSPAALKRLAARLLARSDLIPFIQDQREQRREKKVEYLAVRLRELGVGRQVDWLVEDETSKGVHDAT